MELLSVLVFVAVHLNMRWVRDWVFHQLTNVPGHARKLSWRNCRAVEIDGRPCGRTTLHRHRKSHLCVGHEAARLLLSRLYHARETPAVVAVFLRLLQMHTLFKGRTDAGHYERIRREMLPIMYAAGRAAKGIQYDIARNRRGFFTSYSYPSRRSAQDSCTVRVSYKINLYELKIFMSFSNVK